MYRLQIRNELRDDQNFSECELYIYSSIEHENFAPDVITARKLMDSAGINEASRINLHINSEGGDVFESLAIYNWINSLKAKGVEVNAIVEGICASGASVIAMAASKISMYKNSFMLVHNPMTFASGDSAELANFAQMTAEMENQLVNIYAARTGLAPETVKDLMAKESLMSADTCKTFNFCDEIMEPVMPDPEPEPENKTETRNDFIARIKDSANINVNSNFKPIDHDALAIENMAKFINRKRGF